VIELIADASGVAFTPHDLRRTFATTCARLGTTEYLIKKLLNHVTHHDVTLGYLQAGSRDLREPMQAVTDYFVGMRAKGQGLKLVNAS